MTLTLTQRKKIVADIARHFAAGRGRIIETPKLKMLCGICKALTEQHPTDTSVSDAYKLLSNELKQRK